MKKNTRWIQYLVAGSVAIWTLHSDAAASSFESAWEGEIDRAWPGSAYWANPVKDWRLADGRLQCLNPAPDRNVHLLTRFLGENEGELSMKVRLGFLRTEDSQGRAGFRIGIQGRLDDYRHAVFKGNGLDAGLTSRGRLFIGNPNGEASEEGDLSVEDVELQLSAEPDGDAYSLTLVAVDPDSGEELLETSRMLDADRLVGNIALFSHGQGPFGEPFTQFSDWHVSGGKVEADEERAFGPIWFAQHTLSRGTLKMTAQFAPVGWENNRTARLQIRSDGDDWETISKAPIHQFARTATFKVTDWESSQDVPYRIAYDLKREDGPTETAYWEGTVRKDPVEKESIVVAGFTGHKDDLFPNNHVVEGVRHHDPDLLVFTGDQFYEDSGGYGIEREGSLNRLSLDLLQHWVLLGWSFGDLMADRPSICLIDDHDVYQGNIWGANGRPVDHIREHPRGGYAMPADWVNVVQRVQTSHFPDPYAPTPVMQGIGVYYTDLLYGRVSFAVLEDRKFKTGPEGLVPETESGRPDHIVDPDFDPETVDLPEATLLGQRQLDFLHDWAADWEKTDMKAVVSQTIFAQVPNIHGGNQKRLVTDLDSNGWPQTPRDEALDAMRRGFAFHLSGDQHLPMIVQYGIHDWEDAPYTICVPSISAGYPRAFQPDKPGRNRESGAPEYTGRFHDGLGNKMTVSAVANPKRPFGNDLLERQHNKASGYAIVRFNKSDQTIDLECWPLLSDPADPETQFAGWPKTIDMLENYGRQAKAHLPTIKIRGMENPVIQVINEWSNQIVYTLRVQGTQFRPKVFQDHYNYTIHVGEPGTDQMQTLRHLSPTDEEADGEDEETRVVEF